MRHKSSAHLHSAPALGGLQCLRCKPSCMAAALSVALGLVYPVHAWAVSDPAGVDIHQSTPNSSFTQGSGSNNPLSNHQDWYQEGQPQARAAQAQPAQPAPQAQIAPRPQARVAPQAAPQPAPMPAPQVMAQNERAQDEAVARARAAAMQARQSAMQANAGAQRSAAAAHHEAASAARQSPSQVGAQQNAVQPAPLPQQQASLQPRQAPVPAASPANAAPRAAAPLAASEAQAQAAAVRAAEQREAQARATQARAVASGAAAPVAATAAADSAATQALGRLDAYRGVQPLGMGDGRMHVPAPNDAVDYGANPEMQAVGNGRFDVPPINSEDPNPEDDAEAINPLASPYYDPIIGGIDMDKMRREETLKRIEQGKKPIEALTPVEQMEERLAQYDKAQYELQLDSPQFQAFGNFKHHDEVYNNLPSTNDVFYVDQPKDLPAFQAKVAALEEMVGTDIGFVIFDNTGIIALKDKSPYPMHGLTSFHLAYAVANLMSTRGDSGSLIFSFLPQDLVSNISSPLREALERSSRLDSPDTVKALEEVTSSAERGRGIAQFMREQSEGAVDKDKLRQEMQAYGRYLEELKRGKDENGIKPFILSLNELLHFTLAEGDPNAAKLLLNYVGTLPALELFDRVQGLKQVSLKHLQADAVANPSLMRFNTAPLYESARLLASFDQDKKLSADARDLVESKLYFNPLDSNLIQKGVKNSIEYFSKKNHVPSYIQDSEGYRVYSIKGEGVMDPNTNTRVVLSDMALINYKKHTVVMIIAMKDIPNSARLSLSNGEKAISGLANFLYTYYLERNASRFLEED